MRSDELEVRLKALLADAGVDLEHPTTADIPRTWAAVRELWVERVEDAAPLDHDGDMLLAQYGIYTASRGDEKVFMLDIVRQVSFEDDDGEYDGMAQLQCTFEFEPTELLRSVPAYNHWFSGTDEEFAAVLTTRGFRVVEERGLVPLRLVVAYSNV
jgi:hypothetical protein